MNKLWQQYIIALAIFLLIPKTTLFFIQTIQQDETIFEKQYNDFVTNYHNAHTDDPNVEVNTILAWRKSELYAVNHTKFQRIYRTNYFIQLITSQAVFLTLIYLGCTIASPIIAASYIISSGTTYYMLSHWASGIELWYGMILELVCACIALFFLLRFLYRQSRQ